MRRYGDWFLTYTGVKFYPMDPLPAEVDLTDVAHSLANTCRFNGHCRQFYSVAQHSIIVAQNCPEAPLQALLHDATETYCGDMVRPLKYMLPDYRAAEERIWLSICAAFNISATLHASVKVCDNRALMTERRDILTPSPHPWSLAKDFPPFPEVIHPWTPATAEARFLDLFGAFYKSPWITEPTTQTPAACDHKFIDSATCLKCGWEAPAKEFAS